MSLDSEVVQMVTPAEAAIDALLDGEAVDKETLRVALADSAARDYLVDALLLRQLTGDMTPQHDTGPYRLGHKRATFAKWAAAAAVVCTTALASYQVGRTTHGVILDAPTLVATVPAASVVTTAPPPEPTSVIRFERGTTWISSSEGN